MAEEFSDLSQDVEVISRMRQLRDSISKIENRLDLVSDSEVYDKLSNCDKIKYNLLMSYSLNSLFWMYLRTEGIDPIKHQIKSENDRLKKSMMRAKEISDKKTLMPRLNKGVAQRFVRSSLWQGNSSTKDIK